MHFKAWSSLNICRMETPKWGYGSWSVFIYIGLLNNHDIKTSHIRCFLYLIECRHTIRINEMYIAYVPKDNAIMCNSRLGSVAMILCKVLPSLFIFLTTGGRGGEKSANFFINAAISKQGLCFRN